MTRGSEIKANPRTAEILGGMFGATADSLIEMGIHPGDCTYALASVLAMVGKMYGGTSKEAFKALIVDTIETFWNADDAAQAVKKERS
jgi:hypothetical protein